MLLLSRARRLGSLAVIASNPRSAQSFAAHTSNAMACPTPKYLTAEKAVELDQKLMSTPGFSIDQLMELAGLSVACSIAKEYDSSGKLLIVCGPGNNGGDGLVAARHLFHFGYQTAVYYPKRSPKQLFVNLVHQLEQLDITMLQDLPDADSIKAEYALIVDAIFGFKFLGGIRAPFDSVIRTMKAANIPIASIDIPSGWDVNTGHSDTADSTLALQPEFLPPSMAKQYDLEWLPRYPGTEQCMHICECLPGGRERGCFSSKQLVMSDAKCKLRHLSVGLVGTS
eukprot:9207-Heterococcus_DN1.PRE.3